MSLLQVLRRAIIDQNTEAINLAVNIVGRFKIVELTDDEVAVLCKLREEEKKRSGHVA